MQVFVLCGAPVQLHVGTGCARISSPAGLTQLPIFDPVINDPPLGVIAYSFITYHGQRSDYSCIKITEAAACLVAAAAALPYLLEGATQHHVRHWCNQGGALTYSRTCMDLLLGTP